MAMDGGNIPGAGIRAAGLPSVGDAKATVASPAAPLATPVSNALWTLNDNPIKISFMRRPQPVPPSGRVCLASGLKVKPTK
jgi:hypothetical protein